jgi:hypothetical protein
MSRGKRYQVCSKIYEFLGGLSPPAIALTAETTINNVSNASRPIIIKVHSCSKVQASVRPNSI